MQWSYKEASEFYSEHKFKFFFGRLITYMTSGDIIAIELEGNNAIERWRYAMGPTKPPLAQVTRPDSIRALYGLTDTRNSVHGSDSIKNAKKEASFFFK